jgi:dinuclear metal center YbgI/SA1388 family protein
MPSDSRQDAYALSVAGVGAAELAHAIDFCFPLGMRSVSLEHIVRHCDGRLKAGSLTDYDGAVNGLQVENRGRVSRVAAAVDASLATVKLAIQAGANLLIVHHGLFWGGSHPWTGRRYELLRWLLENDLAVYSSHLPLDCHPRLGNNAQLCRALGLARPRPFFLSRGQFLGLQARTRLSRQALVGRIARAVGDPPRLLPCGPSVCERVGVLTGGAGGELKQAAAEGIDTFITGEGPHWTFALAEELGVNVFYAGHYATETFGVKALAAEVSRRFRLPWVFLDHPSGL